VVAEEAVSWDEADSSGLAPNIDVSDRAQIVARMIARHGAREAADWATHFALNNYDEGTSGRHAWLAIAAEIRERAKHPQEPSVQRNKVRGPLTLHIWSDPEEGGASVMWDGDGVAASDTELFFGRWAAGWRPTKVPSDLRQWAEDAAAWARRRYGVPVEVAWAPPPQLRNNPIPPKPAGALTRLVRWAERTYEPGTPVKLKQQPEEEWEVYEVGRGPDPDFVGALPLGLRGEVLDDELDFAGPDVVMVPVKVVDARDAYGHQINDLIGLEVVLADHLLEPLVDNWAKHQAVRGTPRHRLGTAQRSRMKPNPKARPIRGPAMDTRFGETVENPDVIDGTEGKHLDAALGRYETFHDKAPIRVAELAHDLPERWIAVGDALAVMYRTDKWKKDGDDIDYKHLHDKGEDKPYEVRKGVRLYEPAAQARRSTVQGGAAGPLSREQGLPVAAPKAVTMLGYCLGLFVRRYDDGEVYEVNPRGCWLFCSPSGDMLAVYSPHEQPDGTSGFLAIMAGGNLRVLKDGIDG